MGGKRHLGWRDISMELVAGLLFFAALILLARYTILLSKDGFTKKFELDVVFNDVSGLAEGDNVTIRGVTIGRADKPRLNDGDVRVPLRLKQELKLYKGYKIEIRNSSVLGGHYIAVDAGDPALGAAELPIRGLPPADLVQETTKLVQTVKGEVEKIRDVIEKEQVVSKIAKFVDNVSVITDGIREGKGTLGKLVNDDVMYTTARDAFGSLKSAGDNVTGMVTDVRAGKGTLGKLVTDDKLYMDAQIVMSDLKDGKGTLGKLLRDEAMFDNLNVATANIRQISEHMVRGESSLGRLMMDKGELYVSLKNTLSSAEEVAAALRDGKGTLGKLAMDPTLYEDTHKAILEVRGAVQDFREQVPVSTFGSLIMGGL